MLVNSKKLLRDARQKGYALGAFNVENAEMMLAVINAAEELKAPVILQTTSSTLNYLPPAMFSSMAQSLAQKAGIPIVLHLDHGNSFDLVKTCIASGYTSVMIDGSALPYEENVAMTKQICQYAADHGVSVEAELGIVGGKEDYTVAEGGQYTDPHQAADFVRRTGVDSLAIAIGTAHGFYKTAPVLDLARITLTYQVMDTPLVLHGGSGIPDDLVGQAVALGMTKVNFATELRDAYTKAVRACLLANPTAFDPKKFGVPAMAAVKALVMSKIRLCKSEGKA